MWDIFLFCLFPFSASSKTCMGEVRTFFPGINMLYVDNVKKQAVFCKSGVFKIFGSDKLIFNFYKQKPSFNLLCSSRLCEYSHALPHASQDYVQCSIFFLFLMYLTCLTFQQP